MRHDEQTAERLYRKWCHRLGGSFHPDTRGAEMLPANGRQLTAREIRQFDHDMDEAHALHTNIYALACQVLREEDTPTTATKR